MSKKHDELCLCRRCTERLIAAHKRYLEAWKRAAMMDDKGTGK